MRLIKDGDTFRKLYWSRCVIHRFEIGIENLHKNIHNFGDDKSQIIYEKAIKDILYFNLDDFLTFLKTSLKNL
ncbi:MAG: hypothetical protein ACOC2W_03755 [bacterium]